MVTIIVTKHQVNELRNLRNGPQEEWWERLSDITEHPVEWLKAITSDQLIQFFGGTQAESGTVIVEERRTP